MATLKYRPFAPSNPTGYNNILVGWLSYADTVAQWVAAQMDVTAADRGFDMEIWNELTFGSHYLYIADYYGAPPYNERHQHLYQTGAGHVFVCRNAFY